MAVYTFDSTSVRDYTIVDNGELTSAALESQDFGTIGESPTSTQEYNEIVFTDVAYPYGSASFSGGATVNEFSRNIPTEKVEIRVTGTVTANVVFHWTGSGTAFEIAGGQELIVAPWTVSSGTLRNSFSKTIIGSGSLFNIGFIDEGVVYDYNLSSVNYFNIGDDYGSVAENDLTSYDFGYVNIPQYLGDYDYGLVNVTGDDQSANILFTINGESVYELLPVYTEIGTGLFEVSGSGTSEFKPHWRGRGGIFVSGGEGDSFSRPYEGKGNILNFNSSLNSASYSYNEYSVEEFNNLDYRFIDEQEISNDNYGYVFEQSYVGFDYGYVVDTNEVQPYGLFSLTGEAFTEYKPTFTWFGSGLYDVSGSAESEFKPHWRGRGLIQLSGGEGDSFSRPYEGKGNLFSIIDSDNSTTYIYNESSIERYSSTDYGSITQSGDSIDYDYVYNSSYIEYDYGYTLNIDFVYPYGLFGIKGEAFTEYKPTFTWFGSGLYDVSGSAESEFKPHWRGRGLIQLSGGDGDSFTRPYIGSGNLFSIGDISENVVYDYNESSIETYDDTTDYGSITESGTSIDYNFVYNSSYIEYDYGYVITSIEDRPYGLFKFSGEAQSEYKPSFDTKGTGLFEISGIAKTQFKPKWNGRGLIQLSGGEGDSFTRPYAGSGSLFSIGNVLESASYDYNESSVEFYSDSDYQFISNSPSTTGDYGFITEPSYSEYDYGYVLTPYTEYPFGLFRISGTVQVEYIPNNLQIGSGTLNLSGTASTIFKPNWNGFGVIKLTGGEGDVIVKSYSGFGDLFTIGEKIEKVTFEYNSSSIDLFSEIDYELITNADNIQIDNGTITESNFAGEVDYGTVINQVETRPYGTINISGSAGIASDLKTIVGGSLFGFGGAAESFSAQTPENTVFYSFSGSATEKHTESYVGEGSFKFTHQRKETDTRFMPWWRGYGEIILSGTSEKEKIKRYVSRDGSLFGVNGAAEAFSAQTPENTVFYTFSGSAAEKHTEVYIGKGSLFGFGNAAEAQTDYYTPVETLFNVYGSAVEKHTESYVGRGSINVFTNNEGYEWLNYRPSPRYVTVFGEVFVDGIAAEASTKEFIGTGKLDISGTPVVTRTNKFFGSGSVFTFQGSSESRTVSIDTEYGLFSVNGSGNDSYSRIYNGSGRLFGFDSAAESSAIAISVTGLFNVYGESKNRYVPNWNGSGTINVYDQGDISRSRDYITSGSLFGFGGAAESFSAQTPENTVIFTLSGQGSQSFTKGTYTASGSEFVYGSSQETKSKTYSGFGSLFGFNSATESRSITAKIETSLYKIYGASENSKSRIVSGEGSLFGFGGAAESFSAQTPENTALFVLSGTSEKSRTKTYDGSGTFFGFGSATESKAISHQSETVLYSLQGTSDERFARGSYQSSGSLFGFGGAAESFSAQTPENTVLYIISGTSAEKATQSYVGDIATYTLSGSSVEKFTKGSYQSSGSLFGFGGAAESFSAQTPENTALFVFSGSKKESFSKGNYDASGSLFGFGASAEASTNVIIIEPDLLKISGSATEAFSRSTYQGNVSYEITGGSTVITTQAFDGSGVEVITGESSVLLTFGYSGSGVISPYGNGDFHVEYKTDASTAEFVFYGGTDGSRTIISVTNNLEINISGASIDYVRLFTPPRKFGTII